MGSTRRRFSDEYKVEAVGLVIDTGRSVAEVSRNIGVHQMTLGKWVKNEKEKRESVVPVAAPLTESGRFDLLKLRRQAEDDKSTIAELRMRVEFAKKVATWFAQEKP